MVVGIEKGDHGKVPDLPEPRHTCGSSVAVGEAQHFPFDRVRMLTKPVFGGIRGAVIRNDETRRRKGLLDDVGYVSSKVLRRL